MVKEFYDEALICQNGHLITESYKVKSEDSRLLYGFWC